MPGGGAGRSWIWLMHKWSRNQLRNYTHFRHHTDEQLRHRYFEQQQFVVSPHWNDRRIVQGNVKTYLKQGAQIYQPTAWPIPHAEPYYPGSGSQGQLIRPDWGSSAWYSRRVNKRGNPPIKDCYGYCHSSSSFSCSSHRQSWNLEELRSSVINRCSIQLPVYLDSQISTISKIFLLCLSWVLPWDWQQCAA